MTGEETAKLERDRALKASVELNRRLDAFASTASHDLQEPLRKMAILADVAIEAIAEKQPAAALDNLRRIQGTSRRARLLVSDLLGFSNAPDTEISREPVTIGTIVLEAADLMSEAAKDVGMRIEPPNYDIVVLADRPKFLRLMTNFIAHAIKNRSRTERPRISFMVAIKARKKSVLISISDNGTSADIDQHDMFSPSTARLRTANDMQSTALDLSICKFICDLHGWTLEARIDRRRRVRFVVCVPETDTVFIPPQRDLSPDTDAIARAVDCTGA